MTAVPKPFTVVSKDIRDLPKHEEIPCTLREPGCAWNATCLGHVRNVRALGGNKKPDDSFGFYTCDPCHRVQEARGVDPQHVLEAVCESQHLMHMYGVLRVGKRSVA